MSTQELIIKVFEGSKVFFIEDGYINATKAAKKYSKKPETWLKTEQTQELISEISIALKSAIEQNQLVIVKSGAPSTGGGTWIHPKLAVHFAYWLSPKFAVWVGEQIEAIIKIQQRSPEQQRVEDIIRLLTAPINLASFEQMSLIERTQQKSFTWRQFQEFFGMKRNTYFLRSLLGVVNRRIIGMSAARFRTQVFGPRNLPGTQNITKNLTRDFLPKPHQQVIQNVMFELLQYFQARPQWTRLQVHEKVIELITTKKSAMERLIGRELHELAQECIDSIHDYVEQTGTSPYEVVRSNLVTLNYDHLALERLLRSQIFLV